MNRLVTSESTSRSLIVLLAIVLGLGIGVFVVPVHTLDSFRMKTVNSPELIAVIGAVIAFIYGAVVVIRVSLEKKEHLERDLLNAFLDYIPDNVYFKDCSSRFIRVSRAMAAYCGLRDPKEAVSRTDADIFSRDHAVRAFADEQEILRTGNAIVEQEEKETWPDGHETWVLTTKVPLRNHNGGVIGTMGISHNITDRKRAELRVRYMALHDTLTGLPNRALLEDRLSQAVALARRENRRIAVLILDVDRFRNINDSFGHYIGDQLLESVASRLKSCLRESDTIARLGGDEFAVVTSLADGQEGIEAVGHKLIEAFASPFRLERRQVQISASIGICQFPADGESPADLLQFADSAAYEAKRRGRGRFCVFSPALTEAARRRQRLENDLRQACDRDQFVLHYQPLIDAQSDRISGVEALLRWRHPEFGLISPNQFIPQLEELGMMVEVGRWALRNACRQAVEWQQSGLPPFRIAVNVSTQQFYEGKLVETVRAVLQETKLNPRLLELEITESQTLDDSDATIAIMQGLKRLGVSLSLDDFGTGWSSLSYLRRFPVNRIKLDRSFVRDVLSQPAAEAVVKSILGLGSSLGITCVAEGVETLEVRDYLKKLGCEEMQGFFFSPPLAAFDFIALVRSAQADSASFLSPADLRAATA